MRPSRVVIVLLLVFLCGVLIGTWRAETRFVAERSAYQRHIAEITIPVESVPPIEPQEDMSGDQDAG